MSCLNIDINSDGTIRKRQYSNGKEVYYDKNNNVVKIKYSNGKLETKQYHENGNLKYHRYPNGKEEYFNANKQLIHRKHNNSEEIWERDDAGKCIKYTKHVYYK